MKNAQVINLNEDSVITIDGDNVIDKTDQLSLGIGHSKTTVNVDVSIYDLIAGSFVDTVEDKVMTYVPEVDFWTISISDILSAPLEDRHKYVALVKEHSGGTNNMRQFKVMEFCTDNDSFEATWMRLPYQIEIDGDSYIRWYSDGSFTPPALFEAKAYQGGTGTSYATSPSNVTHRGAIVPVVI